MSSTMFNKPLDTEFVGKVNEFDERVDELSKQIVTHPVLVSITNASLNRIYYFKFGAVVIVYGLVGFNSTTAVISNLPANKSEAYIPLTLIDSSGGNTNKFFNLNPNATSVSCSDLSTDKYYSAICVYTTT